MLTTVTGATGLIGNALVGRLVAAGHEVRAVVRDLDAARRVVPLAVELVRGDLGDPIALATSFEGSEVVFHAAGMPEQWARDARVFDEVNRRGTANVCDAALTAGVRRVVYTSTMDVFRKGPDGRLREDLPDPDPKPSPYERSKVAAEREVDRRLAQGLDVVIVNPSAVYGPTPTRTGLTEIFVRVLTGKAPAVPRGGFSVAYVGAVADAHVAAAERGRTGERYLLADRYVTVREFAAAIARAGGIAKVPREVPIGVLRAVAGVSAPFAKLFGFTPMVAAGGLHFVAWQAQVDATKARSELAYTPMPLDEGVRLTVADLRERGLVPA